jgi:hypothetical protein
MRWKRFYDYYGPFLCAGSSVSDDRLNGPLYRLARSPFADALWINGVACGMRRSR